MKQLFIFSILIALACPVSAQTGLLYSKAVTADATYESSDLTGDGQGYLIYAGIVIHATAAAASAIVYDGTTISSGEIDRVHEATDKDSNGSPFASGGIRIGTNIIIDLTNGPATLYYRRGN